MQEVKDHFRLEQTEIIQGECTNFISEKEGQWRSIDKYQVPPYKRVAAHSRNIVYTPQNVRTFSALKEVLAYLIDAVFPILLDKGIPREEKERVALFLEERLIAIRCQYFVQGIVCPKELLKLLRCFVLTWIMKGVSSGSSPLIGLELLVQAESRRTMETSFNEQYRQALKYALISSQKKELHKLLSNHPVIFEDQELSRLLFLKVKIISNNYHVLYHALQSEQPLIRCLLWLQIEEHKEIFSRIVIKSFGDVPKQWLFQRLCLSHAKQSGWINLKQNQGILQQKGVGFDSWLRLETIGCLLSGC